jgi:hypothetical protein
VLGLGVRRHAAVAAHGSGARVVGRERERHGAVEGVELLAQVLRAALDGLGGIRGIRHAEPGGGARHELAEPAGARGRARVGSKFDSCRMRPFRSAGSTPWRAAASAMSPS